jgi:prefoldin subunit 5
MRIPAWKSLKRIDAHRNGDSLPPNESERLKAQFSEATAGAESAVKRAAAIDEKTIAALNLIGTALRDLTNRVATLERRSSENNESIEELDQHLMTVAKYAVALNQKITDRAAATAGKDEAIDAVVAIRSDSQAKTDKVQSERSVRVVDSVAGLLSNLQASVNDLIERIENLEGRITKLEPRETAIAIEDSSDDVPSRSESQIVYETEGAEDRPRNPPGRRARPAGPPPALRPQRDWTTCDAGTSPIDSAG